MDVERERRVLQVFDRVRDAPAADCAALLPRLCGGDDDLRARVEALLAAHEARTRLPHDEARPDRAAERFALAMVGQVVGQYELDAVTAYGGMGTVFAATQRRPRRRVAVKVLRLDVSSDVAHRHFEREAQILAGLSHPRIVRIIESGTLPLHLGDDVAELPWFAMDLVEGGRPITDHVRSADRSLELALRLFREACDAVQHGHRRGVAHLDLKPDNILVDREGRPTVVDFGIAASIRSGARSTELQAQTGVVGGTRRYMSPEQAEGVGSAAPPDTRMDVFSLGAVLFELVTGEAFAAPASPGPVAAAVRRRWGRRAPGRPRALDLASIVVRATEPRLEARLESASALSSEIGLWLARHPVSSAPASTRHRALLWSLRRPWAALALAAGLAVGLSAVGTSARRVHAAGRAAGAALEGGRIGELRGLLATVPSWTDRAVLSAEARAVAADLRTRGQRTGVGRVANVLEGDGPEAALLVAATLVERDGWIAQPAPGAFLADLADRGSPEVRAVALELLARVFNERPNASPDDDDAVTPVADALVRALSRGPSAAERLNALCALAGAGTPRCLEPILASLEARGEDAAGTVEEEVRLALRAMAGIVRRVNRYGRTTDLRDVDREHLTASAGRIVEQLEEVLPRARRSSLDDGLRVLLTDLALAERRLGLAVSGGGTAAMRGYGAFLVAAARREPWVADRLRALDEEDDPLWAGSVGSEYFTRLASTTTLMDDADLARFSSAYLDRTVAALGLDHEAMRRIYADQANRVRDRMRGVFEQEAPDPRTHLAVLLEGDVGEWQDVPVALRSRGDPLGRVAGVDLDDPEGRSWGGATLRTRNAPRLENRFQPGRHYVGLSGVLRSEVRLEMDLPALLPEQSPYLHIEVQKTSLGGLPFAGRPRIAILWDDLPLAGDVAVAESAQRVLSLPLDVSRIAGRHTVTLRASPHAPGLLRVYAVWIDAGEVD